MAGGSGRCCASMLVIMLSALILLGAAEIAIYLFVRLILSSTLCKTYCWLGAGLLTIFFSASVLFLMVGVKKRSGCLVIAHFVVIFLLQATSWTLSEVYEWRLWWNEQIRDEVRVVYVQVYVLTTAWQAAGVTIAAVATLMSCLTYGCSRRSVNLLDVSAKSSNSWEFVRVRSSTPKKNERQVHNREAAAKSSADKKRPMERRQLSFSGNGFFGEDNPITPISPHAANSKPYGQIESLMPWQPPTTSPDKILDLSAERSDMSSFKREKQSGDMSSFKRENRSEKTTSALFEYEMGVI